VEEDSLGFVVAGPVGLLFESLVVVIVGYEKTQYFRRWAESSHNSLITNIDSPWAMVSEKLTGPRYIDDFELR
jgi:hypothetical protein